MRLQPRMPSIVAHVPVEVLEEIEMIQAILDHIERANPIDVAVPPVVVELPVSLTSETDRCAASFRLNVTLRSHRRPEVTPIGDELARALQALLCRRAAGPSASAIASEVHNHR